MSTRPDIPFTYADYKTLAASTDERHELIDGELYMVPAPTVAHQIVSKNLALRLEQHVSAKGSGIVLYAPLDVVLGAGAGRSVVQPDILFISRERANTITDTEIVGAPDLVIEILSPGTAERDRGQKRTLYARSGVREYWIVDPELESIEVYSLGDDGYDTPVRYEVDDRLFSTVVPGFEAALNDVFESS